MSRYELFIASMHNSDTLVVQMFLYALALVVAYVSLNWWPLVLRRPAKYIYLALCLAGFILVTVYSAGL